MDQWQPIQRKGCSCRIQRLLLRLRCFGPHRDSRRRTAAGPGLGRRSPGYLLQGLTCCARCGYAYYSKTTRQMGLAIR